VSGIYQIRNTINGKVYIGSTVRPFQKRWQQHRRHLAAGTHHSDHLQSAWLKYGQEAFAFEVVQDCDPLECVPLEQQFIDSTKSADRQFGYNASPTAGSPLGTKHSDEARARMSASATGKPKSAAAIEKTAAAHRGRPKSPSQRAKISQSLTGRTVTEERRRKAADAMRGRKLSEEHRQKLADIRRGKGFSDEWRKNIAAAKRGLKQTPETIAKRVAGWKASRAAAMAMVVEK